MILLGVDTCGATCTLALGRVSTEDSLEVLAMSKFAGRSAAAMLVPALTQLLLDVQLSLEAISGLVVVDGPGSFTGIRIGLSTVKALAEARGLPVFAISRLRVLAAAHGARAAALDAGRGEFFLGWYATADEPEEAIGECSLTQEELVSRFASSPGEWRGLVVYDEKAIAAFPLARAVVAPVAADALNAALPAMRAGRQAEVSSLDGRYLWRSDPYRRTQPTAP